MVHNIGRFNANLYRHLLAKYNLQKVAETFNLHNTQDFQNLLITLFEKGLLPDGAEDMILSNGYRLTQDHLGYCLMVCGDYDSIIWTEFGLYSKPESKEPQPIISNIEILSLKDYICGKEDKP